MRCPSITFNLLDQIEDERIASSTPPQSAQIDYFSLESPRGAVSESTNECHIAAYAGNDDSSKHVSHPH